jgi:hypothetical protein
LGFVSYDASTDGNYATTDNHLTLTAFGSDTEYDFCASQRAQVLNLTLTENARTGTVVDPLAFVKP